MLFCLLGLQLLLAESFQWRVSVAHHQLISRQAGVGAVCMAANHWNIIYLKRIGWHVKKWKLYDHFLSTLATLQCCFSSSFHCDLPRTKMILNFKNQRKDRRKIKGRMNSSSDILCPLTEALLTLPFYPCFKNAQWTIYLTGWMILGCYTWNWRKSKQKC